MQFDARAAKALPPGDHIIFDDCPGLRLVASDRRRSWIYRYKSPVDGRMRQTMIGQWPAMGPAKAEVEWEALRSARDAGADPAQQKRVAKAEAAAAAPAAKGYTVRKLTQEYWKAHVEAHRQPKGAKEVKRLFDTRLGPIADRQAAALTRGEAFNLLEAGVGTPVSTGQLRGELASAWDYALDAGRIPETTPNWWRLIMRGRLRSKGKKIEGKHVGTAKRVLSEAETGELVRWLPHFTSIVDDALTLYLWTGTRGSEIVSMEAAEIGEEADGLWWTIPKAKTKNARHALATDLRVPLVGRAQTIVRRRLADHPTGYLFPAVRNDGSQHSEQAVVQTAVHYFQPYSKTRREHIRPRLPVSHWAPHDLRRTCRTLLAAIGCPDGIAEAVLGHMPPGIQAIYNRHSYDTERRLWLTALDVKLEALAAALPKP